MVQVRYSFINSHRYPYTCEVIWNLYFCQPEYLHFYYSSGTAGQRRFNERAFENSHPMVFPDLLQQDVLLEKAILHPLPSPFALSNQLPHHADTAAPSISHRGLPHRWRTSGRELSRLSFHFTFPEMLSIIISTFQMRKHKLREKLAQTIRRNYVKSGLSDIQILSSFRETAYPLSRAGLITSQYSCWSSTVRLIYPSSVVSEVSSQCCSPAKSVHLNRKCLFYCLWEMQQSGNTKRQCGFS